MILYKKITTLFAFVITLGLFLLISPDILHSENTLPNSNRDILIEGKTANISKELPRSNSTENSSKNSNFVELIVEKNKPENREIASNTANEGKSDKSENDEDEDDDDDEDNKPHLTKNGYIEFENFFNTNPEKSFMSDNKKNEIRNHLKLKYGTDTLHIYSITDLYVLPKFIGDDFYTDYKYSDKASLYRNLRMSTAASEINFNELYIHLSNDLFRLRIGNQIYGWGTADVFNPTSYINPMDGREMLFRGEDEAKLGVFSVSTMFFIGDYNLEFVYVPFHLPMGIPANGNFWAVRMESLPINVVIGENRGMDIELLNMGYAARFSGTINGFDMSISGYHGPDKEALMVPSQTVIIPNAPVSIEIAPTYSIFNSVGFDISRTVDKFVFQGEVAYSPDKSGYIEQDLNDSSNITIPYEVKRSHYINYSVGFNYFIPLNKLLKGHEGDTLFTAEWSQSIYFNDKIATPLFSRIVTCKLEDSYVNNKIKVSLTAIIDTKGTAYMIWPKLGYDFLNGLTIEASYAIIHAEKKESGNDPFFYYIKDNDMLILKVKYEY